MGSVTSPPDPSMSRTQRESDIWVGVLAVSTLVGTLAASCLMPFVALAVTAAATLPIRKAVRAVVVIWLANQVLGFTLLGFPLTPPTFASGVVLGLGSLAALAIARSVVGEGEVLVVTRLVSAFALAFLAYELLLFAFAYAGLAGSTDMFTAQIIAQLGVSDAIWLAVLTALRLGLSHAAPHQFGPVPAMRFAG